jgi:hypothetical protein
MQVTRIFLAGIVFISLILKIIEPNIFISFVISIFKEFGINHIFQYVSYRLIGFGFLVPILFIEFLVVYYCFYNKKYFSYLIIFFSTCSLIASILIYYNEINTNCGCFGDMFELNNKQHLFLTLILFILSFVYFVYLNSRNSNNKFRG